MNFTSRLVVVTTALIFSASFSVYADSHESQGHQKAILVTGASTGIGRNLAETLAAKGYFVYAGARKQKDLDDLDRIKNVESVRLDVTVQSDIDAAVEQVRKGGRGLYGLVNNAGVAVIAPLVEVEQDELEFQMDVNVYGPYRVTKAFSPMIIESKGRISTIGSISGILSGFFAGPYSMSKHAIEAYTDTLAQEMAKFEVKVSVVEPGNYRSDIGKSLRRRMESRGFSAENSRYKEEYQGFLSRPADRDQYKEPDDVSAAVLDALFSENPKVRYMVVPDQREAEITIRKAISEMVQLNERHQFSYSRDELVKMIDEALATGE